MEQNQNNLLPINYHQPNNIMFYFNNKCIITIDEEGFKYKDQLVEEGGEVYKLFKEFLKQANTNKHE